MSSENNQNNIPELSEFAKLIQEAKKAKQAEDKLLEEKLLAEKLIEDQKAAEKEKINSLSETEKLSEFAKLIKEGKEAKKIEVKIEVENKKKQLSEKFNLTSDAFGSLDFLSDLMKAKAEKPLTVVENPDFVELPPIIEAPEVSEPAVEEVAESVVEEETPVLEMEEPKPQETIISRSVKAINKISENTNLLNTPAIDKVDPSFKAIQDKLKFLEQWIGKISAAGSGSGSYWLNDLGDTDKMSIKNATDQQVLTFDAASNKWIAADSQGGGGGTTDQYARNRANAAFAQANTSGVIAQAAFDYANTISISTAVDQFARDTANSASSNTVTTQGVDATQNTNITSAQLFANGAFTQANAAVNQATNAVIRASAANTTAQSAFDKANSAGTFANGAFTTANSASSNTVTTQGVDATQNTNITIVGSFANSSFLVANSASSNTITLQGVDDTQNTNISSAQSFANSAFLVANSASSNTIITQGVDATQNTNITNADNKAQLAYDKANNALANTGGTITGDLTVTGTAYNTGISLTGSRANIFIGNDTRDARTMLSLNSLPNYYSGIQINRSNSELWFLGANSSEKFVLRRNNSVDAVTVDSSTGFVNIAESLIVSGNVTANGINVISQIGQAYNQANSASSNTVTTQGVDTTQNTNISSAQSFANGAFVVANSAAIFANGAFTKANTAITTSGGSITGSLNVAYTPATTVNTALQITAANTVGGTGYADALRIINSSGGATNPNKTFRLNSVGTLEILNSAYSNVIFSVTDAGYIAIAQCSSTANGIPINNGIAMANNSYIYDDGNYHITSKTGSIWINSNDGNPVNINTQMPAGITGGGLNVQGAVKSYAAGSAATSFISGAGAISGVALQMDSGTAGTPANMAIRDTSTVSSTMYFDISTGGSGHGTYRWRSSSSFTELMTLSNTSATINRQMLIGGGSQGAYVTISSTNSYNLNGPYGYLNSGGAGSVGSGGSSGTVGWSLQSLGRIQSAEIDVTSDERLKNIQGTIPLDRALQFVRTIDGILYTWKPGFGDEGLKSGFGAQSVHKAGFDHMVAPIPNDRVEGSTDADGFTSPDKAQLTLNYLEAIPYHHEVIKNLLDRIEKLESEITELKKK